MINWREIPFVRLVLALIAGIVTCLCIHETEKGLPEIAAYILLLILFIVSCFFAYRKTPHAQRWIFGVLLMFFFFIFGYQHCKYSQYKYRHNYFAKYLHPEAVLIGKLVEAPQNTGKWRKCKIRIQGIRDTSAQWKKACGLIQGFIQMEIRTERLKYGDVITFSTQPFRVEKPGNPKAFNYRQYLDFQNVQYQAFIKEADMSVLEKNKGNAILASAFQLRKYCMQLLQKYLYTDNERAVGQALTLGYKSDLSDEVRNAYAHTGAMHVLAVSGLHVGFVYLIIAFLLKLIKWHHPAWKFIKVALSLLGVWAFALVTGASPSVMRAATMFSFIIVGMSLKRYTNIYNTLAASAFFLLLYNPLLIANIGFQLSYLAVTGIVYFQPKIYRLWIPNNNFADYIWQLAAVSLAAQLITFPLSLLYFHQFPVFFWLSGLIVVPAATVILSLGIALFIVGSILPFLAPIIGFLLYWVIWLTNAAIFLIQQIPAGLISGIWISIVIAILLYLAIIAGVITINTRKRKWLFGALSLVLFALMLSSYKSVNTYHQRKIVIYQTRKGFLLDCIDGKNIYSVSSSDLEEKTERYAAENYRGFLQAKALHASNVEDDFSSSAFRLQNGLIQFYDKTIYVIRGELPEVADRINVDYLFLTGNPKADIYEIAARFNFGTLLIGAANSRYRIRTWKEICSVKNVPYYDISEHGAWELNTR